MNISSSSSSAAAEDDNEKKNFTLSVPVLLTKVVQDLNKGFASMQTILEKLADGGGLANFDQAVATPLVPHKDTKILV